MSQAVCQWQGISSHRTSQRRSSHDCHYLVKQIGELLPNAYDPQLTSKVGELDELETFVLKKQDLAVNCN